jgi:hypothetical protein
MGGFAHKKEREKKKHALLATWEEDQGIESGTRMICFRRSSFFPRSPLPHIFQKNECQQK